MYTTVNISALTVFVFLGVFRGIIISTFLIFKRSQNRKANIYQGLLFLSLSLCILEQFLNMTGLILKVLTEFESKQYFTENLASLTDLSKRVGESQHHVSQVINEKLNKSFFELLASFRIGKAKSIITDG